MIEHDYHMFFKSGNLSKPMTKSNMSSRKSGRMLGGKRWTKKKQVCKSGQLVLRLLDELHSRAVLRLEPSPFLFGLDFIHINVRAVLGCDFEENSGDLHELVATEVQKIVEKRWGRS